VKNGREYVDSLRKLSTKVYLFGELLENHCDHAMLRPHVNAARLTFDLALSPQYEDLMTAVSHLTGRRIRLVESMHGAGSPQAQRVMLARQANLEGKKEFARVVAGVQKNYPETR